MHCTTPMHYHASTSPWHTAGRVAQLATIGQFKASSTSGMQFTAPGSHLDPLTERTG